jgi:hypothetical protein
MPMLLKDVEDRIDLICRMRSRRLGVLVSKGHGSLCPVTR